MKTIKLTLVYFVILAITKCLSAQSITVDGYAFLENQGINSGIHVLFKQVAPTILYDSVLTEENGYFSLEIEEGIYNVYYSKSEYLPDSLVGQSLYNNTTLPDITLEETGLSGQLSGTIAPGIYKVGGNIEVASGDLLIIEPGVKLLFAQYTDFTINGQLVASGSETDSIYFTSYNDSTWNGIRINENSNNSIISYSVIENSSDKGLEIYNSNPSLSNLTILNNNAYHSIDPNHSRGGGLFINDSDPIIKDILFVNNYGFLGSAIHAIQSTFSITNCVFRNHISHSGATVYLEDNSEVEIINSQIINSSMTNWTSCQPTAIAFGQSSLVLQNTIIANNQYGGVRGNESYIKSINSLFFNNNGYIPDYGPTGCGIKIYDSEANIINSIFTNHALYGIINGNENVININNSCFWNNDESILSDPVNFIGIIVTVNMNGDSCDAYHNIIEDPLFADTANLDFSLFEISPCIDAGLNDSINFYTDILNNVRIFDGNNDGDTIVDIGPYEFGAPVYTSNITHNNFDTPPTYIIYPNPSTGIFNLVSNNNEIIAIEIFNIKGQLVYKDHFDLNSNIKNLNLMNQPKGMYLIRLINKDTVESDLILIQ